MKSSFGLAGGGAGGGGGGIGFEVAAAGARCTFSTGFAAASASPLVRSNAGGVLGSQVGPKPVASKSLRSAPVRSSFPSFACA